MVRWVGLGVPNEALRHKDYSLRSFTRRVVCGVYISVTLVGGRRGGKANAGLCCVDVELRCVG